MAESKDEEDTCFVWGTDLDPQREEQDRRALEHLFPRHYAPPALADAAQSARFPDFERAAAACAQCDLSAAAAAHSALTRTDMEAIAMLTLNDNLAECPLAVVNAALCCGKHAEASTEELNTRDERLCEVCDYLWLLYTGLRKLPRVPRSLLFRACPRRPPRLPKVGETLVSPGFLFVATKWDAAKERASQGAGGVLYALHECWGYNIGPMSFYGHEDDLLLEPGTQFRVDEVSVKERYTVVHLYRRDTPLYLDQRIPLPPPPSQQQQPPPLPPSATAPAATAAAAAAPSAAPTTASTTTGTAAAAASSAATAAAAAGTPQTTANTQLATSTNSAAATTNTSTSSGPLRSPRTLLRVAAAAALPAAATRSGRTESAAPQVVVAKPARTGSASPGLRSAAAEDEDTPARRAKLAALCPSERSAALTLLESKQLLYFPESVTSGLPLAAALATSHPEHHSELMKAAQELVASMGPDLMFHSGDAATNTTTSTQRNSSFGRNDAEALVLLTTNDSQPNSVLAALNSALVAATNDAGLQPHAGLLWHVLRALRKLPLDRPRAALYRGVLIPADTPLPAVGSTVVWSDFFYAALEQDAEQRHLADTSTDATARRVVFRLPGASGYDLSPYCFFGHTSVRLVEPGGAYRVVSVEHGDGIAPFITTERTSAPLLLESRLPPFVPAPAQPAPPPLPQSPTAQPQPVDCRMHVSHSFAAGQSGAGTSCLCSSGGSSSSTGSSSISSPCGSTTIPTSMSMSSLATGSARTDTRPHALSAASTPRAGRRKEVKKPRDVDALFAAAGAPDAAVLDLSNKGLAALPRPLPRMPQLSVLLLSGNALKGKHLAPAPGSLPALRELDLSYNQVSAIPDGWAVLGGSLQVLRLAHNALKALPPALGELRRLRVLDASHNRIRSAPEALAQCTALEELRLADNGLDALPAGIGQLAALRVLDVADNRLKTLPESVGQLGRLDTLLLAQNQLAALPASFAQLGQFAALDLSHNQFERVPECLAAMGALERLDMDDNKLRLKPLQQWLPQAASLTHLSIRNNPCSAKVRELGLTLANKQPIQAV